MFVILALYRSTPIHHMLQLCANANLSGRGPSILLTQTRTTLFLLCTKSYIVWRKIGVWCSFYWKFIKRKSLKLLGTSRSFRLCYLKIGNLLVNRLHRGDVARTGPVFVQQAPTTSTIPVDFLKNPPTNSNSVHESCVQFWSQPFFDGA